MELHKCFIIILKGNKETYTYNMEHIFNISRVRLIFSLKERKQRFNWVVEYN